MTTKLSLLFTLTLILAVCIPHAHSQASQFLHTAAVATSTSAAHNDVIAGAKFSNYNAPVPHPLNNTDDDHNGGSSSKRDQKQGSGGDGGVFYGYSSNADSAGGGEASASPIPDEYDGYAAAGGGVFNGNSSNAYGAGGGEASSSPIPDEDDGYSGGGFFNGNSSNAYGTGDGEVPDGYPGGDDNAYGFGGEASPSPLQQMHPNKEKAKMLDVKISEADVVLSSYIAHGGGYE